VVAVSLVFDLTESQSMRAYTFLHSNLLYMKSYMFEM
jgi:hypothetical protein